MHLFETPSFYVSYVQLPPDAADLYEAAAWNFLALNTRLANHFHPQHIVLFHTTMKFHYMLHCAKQARRLHPRFGLCYAWEDFQKKMRLLVASCQRGTKPSLIASKVVQRYLRGLEFRLGRRLA